MTLQRSCSLSYENASLPYAEIPPDRQHKMVNLRKRVRFALRQWWISASIWGEETRSVSRAYLPIGTDSGEGYGAWVGLELESERVFNCVASRYFALLF